VTTRARIYLAVIGFSILCWALFALALKEIVS
jgi:hypothetical protein